MNWNKLIELFEKHGASSEFIAECVCSYFEEHCQQDDNFINDLLLFIEGERK
jgi:hypothetical protein